MNIFSSILLLPSIAHISRVAGYAIFGLTLLNIMTFIYPTALYSIIGLGIFCLFTVALARHAPVSFILLLKYIFFRFTTLISGIAIEFGAEMPELGLIGEASGSTVRLIMVYVFFITVSAVVIELIKKVIVERANDYKARINIQFHIWVPLFFLALTLVTVIVLIIGSKAGFPMFTGNSRLAFREEVGSKFFLLYMTNRSIFVALLGLLIAVCTGLRRKLSISLFLMLIGVSILFGEKFTSLVSMAMLVIIPSIILNGKIQSLNLAKLGAALTVITAFTVPIILSVYGWSEDPILALERLTGRFAGQGQLWFVADRDVSCLICLDLEALQHNLVSFLSTNASELSNHPPYFGAKYFMFNYMESGLLFLFLETKALTLTFALEAYLLSTNGWMLQLLPLTMCAVTYAMALSYLMYGFFKSDPISIFFALKLLIWINGALQQGELWFLFGYKIVIFTLICFFYERYISGRRFQWS
jgi:hypothetical protein